MLVRDAMDAKARKTKRVEAYGKAVWSRRPDAGVKFADDEAAGDGGNKARLTEESAE
jgi:hypothetical protein